MRTDSSVVARPTLAVLAMAQNECTTLGEWLSHYRAQGVSEFHLIDNNSTELTARCRRLMRSPDVTVWPWSGTSADPEHQNVSNMVRAYNTFLPHVRATRKARPSLARRSRFGVTISGEGPAGVLARM